METEIIQAVSKFKAGGSMLKAMMRAVRNQEPIDFQYRELAGGLCNGVYLVQERNQKMVIKIGPPDNVKMMRHERDILKTEADMLKKMEDLDIPAPRLLLYDDSAEICPVPYLVMTFIAGSPLMGMAVRPDQDALVGIKHSLGEICRKISSQTAPAFGIPAMPETWYERNSDFVSHLFRLLLLDAKDKNINIPSIADEALMTLIDNSHRVLDEVKIPCIIHTDTWEGNLMIHHNRLEGLVDFAAMLYGDPLMNHDFHDFSEKPNPDFLTGYGIEALTDSQMHRILIYRIWQRLGMIVERGYRGYDDPNHYIWVLDEFTKEVNKLQALFQ